MKNLFDVKAVCLATGVKGVTLRSWHAEQFGLKTEGPVLGERSARRRGYTFTDALAVAVMSRLIRRGIDRRHAAGTVNDWRQYFPGGRCFAGGPLWLTVVLGQTDDEFYSTIPTRKAEDRDLYRMPKGYRAAMQNEAVKLNKVFEPEAITGAVPEDVIVLAIHEIARDLQNKLESLS